MVEKDIISFRDFLGNSLSPKSLEILSKIQFDTEDRVEEFSESIEEELEEVKGLIQEDFLTDSSDEDIKEVNITDTEYYTLYSDKNENFTCDIHIEGASPEKSEVRLVIESENCDIVFRGHIESGKCVIPVKSLQGIIQVGQTGKIKLEVIAEGSVLVPWENNYQVKKSKSVTVNFK